MEIKIIEKQVPQTHTNLYDRFIQMLSTKVKCLEDVVGQKIMIEVVGDGSIKSYILIEIGSLTFGVESTSDKKPNISIWLKTPARYNKLTSQGWAPETIIRVDLNQRGDDIRFVAY
jgi:hypothetical protein